MSGDGDRPSIAHEPPHNIDAEMSVLGALLLGGDRVGEICRSLKSEDFYRSAHREIYSAVLVLCSQHAEIDGISVAEELRRRGTLAESGGDPYLVTLAEAVPSPASAAWHANIVREKAQLRRMVEAGQEIVRKAMEATVPAADLLAEARQSVEQISERLVHADGLPWTPIRSLDGDPPAAARWLFRLPTRDGQPAAPGCGDGFLRRGRVASLVGAGGTGKTYCLLDAAIAVACAGRWLNYFPVEGGGGKVLALLGEEDDDEVRRRVHYATRHLEADARRLVERRLVVLPMMGRTCGLLRTERGGTRRTELFAELLARLRGEAGTEGWALIVLEPLSRVAGVPLDVDNDNATAIVQVAEQFTEVVGSPSVLIGIHSNKMSRRPGATTEVRGASALTDGVRAELHLYRDQGRLYLHAAKNNYAPFMPTPGVELVVGEHGVLRAAAAQARTEDPAAKDAQAKAETLAQDTAAILGAFDKIPGGESTSIDAVVRRARINLQRGRTAFRIALEDGHIVNRGTSKKARYRRGGETPHTPRRTSDVPAAGGGSDVLQRPDGVRDVLDVDQDQEARERRVAPLDSTAPFRT